MNLKLKRTPGIYVVGFMGAGKSTIGRLLADRLGWQFIDLDDDIEAAGKMSISAIFESAGEAEFRRIEHAALRARVAQIECGRPAVVALGGGAFAQDVNRDLLAGNGISVWLDCPFPVVERRVAAANHRHLARDPRKFAELYELRREAYSRAEFRIPIEGDDPTVAVNAILALPLFR
jgi:shikimate kinase